MESDERERQRAPRPASPSAFARILTPRAAAGTMFFDVGLGYGAWSGASASIAGRIDLSRSTYGAALTLFTAAHLLAMSSAGAISHSFTAKRALSDHSGRAVGGLLRRVVAPADAAHAGAVVVGGVGVVRAAADRGAGGAAAVRWAKVGCLAARSGEFASPASGAKLGNPLGGRVEYAFASDLSPKPGCLCHNLGKSD